MKNYRKLILGLVYLLCMTGIALYSIGTGHPVDLGMGSFAGGVAAGVGTLVWGYNKEHEFEQKTPPAS
jgi:hypothetical protein